MRTTELKSTLRTKFRFAEVALVAISLLIISGCSPDVDYISSPKQFAAACSFCRPCKNDRQFDCARPEETCHSLCSSDQTVSRILDGYWICRCSGTNDIWAFDPVEKTTTLTQAPWNPPEDVVKSSEELIQ